MDNKITGRRVKNVLTYDLFGMGAFLLVAVILWIILFSVFAPRISLGQKFYLYAYGDMYSPGGEKLLADAQKDGYLSYDVRQRNFSLLNGDMASTQLSTWLGAGEGDVLVVTEDSFPNVAIAAYNPEKAVEDAKKYCLTYGSSPDGKEFIPDGIEISLLFNQRKKDDKRFKTSEEKKLGVEYETARITALWDSARYLEEFFAYCKEISLDIYKYAVLAKDYIILQGVDSMDGLTEEEAKVVLTTEEFDKQKEPYAIDLSKLTGGKSVVNDFYRYKEDGDGELTVKTVDGLYFVVLNYGGVQKHLQFESITFLSYVIKTYSGFSAS